MAVCSRLLYVRFNKDPTKERGRTRERVRGREGEREGGVNVYVDDQKYGHASFVRALLNNSELEGI